MANHSDQNYSALCFGITAGGLIGAAAALLLAPKSGQNLRKDLCAACDEFNDKAHHLAHGVLDMSHKAYEKASDYVGNGKKKTHFGSQNHVIAGALGGGILGIATYLLLTSRLGSEHEECSSFSNRFMKVGKTAKENLRSVDWFETAREVVDAVKKKIDPEYVEEAHPNRMQSALDWAVLGLHLLQNVKKRS